MKSAFVAVAAIAVVALGGCTTAPRPLVPDTTSGPTSYVCYSSMISEPTEIRAIAERQCGRWGQNVTGLIGQGFEPLRCGFLTPTVAAFQCGAANSTPYPYYR